MQVDWILPERAPQSYLTALSTLHPSTAQVLYARGLHDPAQARAFLDEDERHAPPADPMKLKDMQLAVDRILAGIGRGEKIVVYGDYDCDGVTASVLLVTTLRSLGANVHCYIPDRFEEGYGLNSAALDKLKAEGASLIVTVDCGARAHREALHAQTLGLDLIITDHHETEHDSVPCAIAVINPRQPGCLYPFKKLAGVGVAFRLAQALLRQHRAQIGQTHGTGSHAGQTAVSMRALLELVAIGTVADIVSLTGENRWLVRAGIQQINKAPRVGLKALLQVARVPVGNVNAGQVGFALAPRLNAAGRLEHALAAFELLMTDDPAQAEALAHQLNLQNEHRQHITTQMAQQAELAALYEQADTPLLFAASTDYNAGVIGLAAARLVEKYYRPSIVISIANGEARGSCRSVNGFHITEALDACEDLLLRHGGHAAAAGFTAPMDKLNELHTKLVGLARDAQPTLGWQRRLHADGEIELDRISGKLVSELEKLEPHGMENFKPTFVARNVQIVSAQRMGKVPNGGPGPHLKLNVRQMGEKGPIGKTWEVVAWRMGERFTQVRAGDLIDIAFQIDPTVWNGISKVQLEAKDFVVTHAERVANELA